MAMSAVGAGVAATFAVLLAFLGGGAAPARRRAAPASARSAGRPVPAWFAEGCRQLLWTHDLSVSWALARTAAGFVALLALLVWGLPGAVLVTAGACLAPRLLAKALEHRRLAERDRQLPDAMERIATSLRAGALLGPALLEVAGELQPPLGDELRRATGRLENGESVATTLDRWAQEPGSSPAVALTATALSLGAEAGGEVARAVDGVAATLRERRQLQAEVRALATQARTSAWLLASAPLGFAALVATIEPGVVGFLFATPLGLGCLLAGITLDAIGVTWMARIVGKAS